jgi:hypothetical protein
MDGERWTDEEIIETLVNVLTEWVASNGRQPAGEDDSFYIRVGTVWASGAFLEL